MCFLPHRSLHKIIETTLLTASRAAGNDLYSSVQSSRAGLTCHRFMGQGFESKASVKVPGGKPFL